MLTSLCSSKFWLPLTRLKLSYLIERYSFLNSVEIPLGIYRGNIVYLQVFKNDYKIIVFLVSLSILVCYVWLSIVKRYFNISKSRAFIFQCIFLFSFSSRMFTKKYHDAPTVNGRGGGEIGATSVAQLALNSMMQSLS